MPADTKTKNKSMPQSKKASKNTIKEKWLFIKSQAIIESTPAMKRSIDRSVGNIYTKTGTNYRAKDGTAITAERLITKCLGKITQCKDIATKNGKNITQKLNSDEKKKYTKKTIAKK